MFSLCVLLSSATARGHCHNKHHSRMALEAAGVTVAADDLQGQTGWQQQAGCRCRATLTGARHVTLRSVDVDDMQAFLQQGPSAPSDFQREPDSLRMCALSCQVC